MVGVYCNYLYVLSQCGFLASRVVRFVVRFAFRVFRNGRSNPITSRCFVLRDVCFVHGVLFGKMRVNHPLLNTPTSSFIMLKWLIHAILFTEHFFLLLCIAGSKGVVVTFRTFCNG